MKYLFDKTQLIENVQIGEQVQVVSITSGCGYPTVKGLWTVIYTDLGDVIAECNGEKKIFDREKFGFVDEAFEIGTEWFQNIPKGGVLIHYRDGNNLVNMIGVCGYWENNPTHGFSVNGSYVANEFVKPLTTQEIAALLNNVPEM